MSKLTLSVDKIVVSRAKRYAKEQGISISKIVETYLAAVVDSPRPGFGKTPVLNSLRGSLNNANIEDYRFHLAAKYR
jgi:hypothetical protein